MLQTGKVPTSLGQFNNASSAKNGFEEEEEDDDDDDENQENYEQMDATNGSTTNENIESVTQNTDANGESKELFLQVQENGEISNMEEESAQDETQNEATMET